MANSNLETHGAKGVARRIDDLGRVVIPSEFRKAFGIAHGEILDMTIEGDAIVLRRIASGCALCGGTGGGTGGGEGTGVDWHGRPLCGTCVTGIKALP
jgi:AbrB family looped-hinge helix DNA binding protein